MLLTLSGGFVMIPHSAAMAWAVRAKSPVTMKIRIPAPRKVETTDGISSLGGSTIPTIPTKVRPVRAWCMISSSKFPEVASSLICSLQIVLRAKRITRLPCEDHVFLMFSIFASVSLSRTLLSPSMLVYFEQRPIKTSGAPLIVKRL